MNGLAEAVIDLWIWLMARVGFMPRAEHEALVERINSPIVWTPASHLAPVGCPLMLNLGSPYDHDIAYGERVGHLQHRDGEMTYLLSTGEQVTGKFDWTYP